jgi:hypothetical protein
MHACTHSQLAPFPFAACICRARLGSADELWQLLPFHNFMRLAMLHLDPYDPAVHALVAVVHSGLLVHPFVSPSTPFLD